MSEGLNERSSYEGLLEHNLQHLGKFRYAEPADNGVRNRGYDLVFYDLDEHGVTSVTTNGLRFQAIDALLPEELICTLSIGEEGFAHHLVGLVASRIIQRRKGLEFGEILVTETPLIDDTQISGVLAATSPFFGTDFDFFCGSGEHPVLQTITLLPITSREAKFVVENSPDELWDAWKASAANILTINRPSTI
ncbi:suppressor of fused domain protein [Nocardia sp. NPDC059240]|uniref:suppressor of fused domain protein n=1 Tax=Nocardia sp. NPDC059240 TaxID=3346786 RepID=UPI0036AC87CC